LSGRRSTAPAANNGALRGRAARKVWLPDEAIREIVDGSRDGASLARVEEVNAIAAARIKALLKSAAVIQGVEQPVADDHERQHREKRDDIDEFSALEIVRLRVRWRVQAIKLEFLRSILRQLCRPG
jgi:hypothetical protein